jgi:aspartate 1-decarboxylase
MAVVTGANPTYHGSLTLDLDLMDAAALRPSMKVLVANCANGERFETYIIEGQRGAGEVCLNGAAALLGKPGDKVIILSFCALTEKESANHQPIVIHVAQGNRPVLAVTAAGSVG